MTQTVAVIGPGRVGTALALALPADGYRVAAVAGAGAASLARFSQRFPDTHVSSAAAAAKGVDLVLVAVPDDALVHLVREVARDDGVRPGSRWVHVAGGHGVGVLRPAALAGAHVAACHPAQTFPDPERGREHLAGAAWAVTAASNDIGWARELVTDLGGVPYEVPEHARVLYHAALAVGSNGVSAVVSLARDLLLGAGLREPDAFLACLAEASARGAAHAGAAALTGPVRRGDVGTIAGHLAELDRSFPEAADAYRAVSRLALAYARRAGLEAEAAEAVEGVLRDPDR